MLKACWVGATAQNRTCWASDRVLGTFIFHCSIKFLDDCPSPDSSHRISTGGDGRKDAFGMGTRVAERAVEILMVRIYTIGAPFPAVFDLARPLFQLGTALWAV